MLEELYVFGSPTSVLIRSDLARKRKEFFDESSFSIHVDTAACYDVLQHTDFGFVHQVLTYTRRHSGTVTATSSRLNSYLPGKLMCLKKYGPTYLDPTEYEHCLDQLLARYYKFLGEAVLERRDKQFWDYHTSALKTLGCPIRWSKLLKAALLEAKDLLCHPVETLGRLLRFVWNRLFLSCRAGILRILKNVG